MSNLLVCFQSGARGEFLASILLGYITKNKPILNLPLSLFKKIHHINELDEVFSIKSEQIKNYFSVRIKLNTLTDFMKVIYLRKIKSISNEWFESGHLLTCIHQELYHRQFDNKFDYIFDFKYIDNLDYIKVFYQQCFQKPMSQEIEDWAIKNINLNLNLINNEKYKSFLNDFEPETFQLVEELITDQSI